MKSRFVTFQDMKEHFRLDSQFLVIDHNTIIHVNTWISVGWFVENFSFERVLNVVSDIIISEGNNLVLGESIFFEDVISVIESAW